MRKFQFFFSNWLGSIEFAFISRNESDYSEQIGCIYDFLYSTLNIFNFTIWARLQWQNLALDKKPSATQITKIHINWINHNHDKFDGELQPVFPLIIFFSWAATFLFSFFFLFSVSSLGCDINWSQLIVCKLFLIEMGIEVIDFFGRYTLYHYCRL